jgi:hypothetical protein
MAYSKDSCPLSTKKPSIQDGHFQTMLQVLSLLSENERVAYLHLILSSYSPRNTEISSAPYRPGFFDAPFLSQSNDESKNEMDHYIYGS